jgi:hypothetical protein
MFLSKLKSQALVYYKHTKEKYLLITFSYNMNEISSSGLQLDARVQTFGTSNSKNIKVN